MTTLHINLEIVPFGTLASASTTQVHLAEAEGEREPSPEHPIYSFPAETTRIEPQVLAQDLVEVL